MGTEWAVRKDEWVMGERGWCPVFGWVISLCNATGSLGPNAGTHSQPPQALLSPFAPKHGPSLPRQHPCVAIIGPSPPGFAVHKCVLGSTCSPPSTQDNRLQCSVPDKSRKRGWENGTEQDGHRSQEANEQQKRMCTPDTQSTDVDSPRRDGSASCVCRLLRLASSCWLL